MKTHAFFFYGQGGITVDAVLSGDGIGYLQKRVAAIPGIVMHDPTIVQPPNAALGAFSWDAGQRVYDEAALIPKTDQIMLIGGSLGACEIPLVAASIPQDVDLIIGIQPSLYGRRNLVPKNVKRAVCIYNPWGFITLGLGAAKWERVVSNTRTDMQYQVSYWPHPGDNNEAVRTRVINETLSLVGIVA